MKNYTVKIDMGFKVSEITLRAYSQEDAEKYVSERLHTEEFLNINPSGKTKVIFS